ncbi:15072_t:CDS:2 [Funneliformis caledonium]|uniref:15072_t:CDS:1 n=1 Tax=Funneliformis caledonium TaxID=1117310 RepID=A0A9N9AFC3_9GLOM|nr:15072_t:CDS:2 [Funneliformis caledonium]
MQPTSNSTASTSIKPYLPPIKFLLDSPVEMFNDQQRIPVEHRCPNSYMNTSSRKLPTLSLNIPCPKVQLISPVERSVDNNMSGYHHKGNQYQNNLPSLPSISVTIGQIEPALNNNSRNITSVQKHSRPNSIQSLILSPPESPDMVNNPSFDDYEPQHRRYDRAGEYHQGRVVYDHAYTEQQRAYPSSNISPTTLQPAFSPFESRPATTLPRLDVPSPVLNNENVITRRLGTPKVINDHQINLPVAGVTTSNTNNRYQCPYCSKRFSRPSSLRIHTYSHTGEKPFVCTESGCGRKFSVQSNMRRHLRVHRLGRPVKKVRYDGEVEGVKMLNHGPIMRNC